MCWHAFSVYRVSQGSVATLIRLGGWSQYLYMYHSFQNLTVKTVLKSVDFWRSSDKNKLAPFYGPQCIMDVTSVSLYILCTSSCMKESLTRTVFRQPGATWLCKYSRMYWKSAFPHKGDRYFQHVRVWSLLATGNPLCAAILSCRVLMLLFAIGWDCLSLGNSMARSALSYADVWCIWCKPSSNSSYIESMAQYQTTSDICTTISEQ